MKIKGEDAVEAVTTWAKQEVSDLGTRTHDIGKFFFTVSSASAAVIVAIERLQAGTIDIVLSTSLIFLGFSLIAAISIVFPRVWKIDDSVNLWDEHAARVKFLKRHSKIWFGLYLVGLVFGVLATLT